MTSERSDNPSFRSDDDHLIGLDALGISNFRNRSDAACFDSVLWSGVQQGTDGYPAYDDEYDSHFIGGGQEAEFKATAIEIYGVIL